jgi:membrane AbrB-like protein
LFAGMLVGIGVALRSRHAHVLPRHGVAVGEAVIGVTLGAFVQLSTAQAVFAHAVPVFAITLITLGLTVGAGLLLARWTHLDAATASLGMVAGGATGVIVIADKVGADQRLVAIMQYVRVLIVMAATPVVAVLAFPATGAGAQPTDHAQAATGLLFTAVAASAGLLIARAGRLPAPTLLAPMLVAAALTVAGAPFAVGVPARLADVAFAVIGLDVGLGFTAASLRSARRILPKVLVMVVGLLLACALLALALAPLAHVSRLDAYLATTPGGLYAVLAAAVDGGANTTFILAVQVLRLFVMLFAAPALASRLGRRAAAA